MVSKKNRQLQLQRQAIKKNRYTIKRLSIGVASVLVGVGLSFGGNTLVKADMADTNIEQTGNNDPLAQQKKDQTSAQGVSNDVIKDTASENAAASSLVDPIKTDKETSKEVSQVSQNVADKEVATSSATVESSPQDALNKVDNGSFDGEYTANKDSWEYSADGNAKVVTDDSGSHAAIVGTDPDSSVMQKISTTAGKEYSFEADVRLDTDIDSGMYLVAKEVTNGQPGKVLQQIELTGVKGDFAHKKFTFTATTAQTYIGLVKKVDQAIDLGARASLDNVSVKENEKYDLVWEDDFKQDQLDQNTWGYELGSVRGNEQQHYTDSKDNVYLEDGKLVLQITDRRGEDQYTNPRGGANGREVIYDSGSVRTAGKKEFLYGKIEMRAKLPKGKGAFPAFWTLGSDFTLDGDISADQGYGWPSTGEIDIMELIGSPNGKHAGEVAEGDQSNSKVYGTPHFYYEKGDADKDGSYSPYEMGGNLSLNKDFYDEFHTFGINWSPDKIEWYVDGVVYNTLDLTADERAKAAAACFNKPQYIQLNLAAGGNWAKNAGYYLGKDDTKFIIDYVKYYQSDEQKAAAAAYYATVPKIDGIKDITMTEKTAPDLLAGVDISDKNYQLDYSVEDEYMFTNVGQNTNSTLRVSGVADQAKLKELAPGVYNIYYSAVPKGVDLTKTPTAKVIHQVAHLTVLPAEGLVGKTGETLASVALPEGFSWQDPTQVIGSASSYGLNYQNEGKRTVLLELPAEQIHETSLVIPENKTILETGDLQFDGTQAVAKENSAALQDKIAEIMHLGQGTFTFRYHLDPDDTIVRNSQVLALLSLSVKGTSNEYATFYLDTKNNRVGLEFKGKPIVKFAIAASGLNNSDWHTLSYVFTGQKVKLYMDGNQIGATDFSGALSDLDFADRVDTLTLGAMLRKYNGVPAFQWGLKGEFDQVLVSDQPADADMITSLHQATARKEQNAGSLWDKYSEGVFEYRIPSLVKTPQGTLVAVADARKKHYNDWGDVATVVRVSHDDGKTWSDNIVVLDLATQPYFTPNYSKADWNTNMTQSAFTIDPTLLTDSNGKLYLLVDAYPESQGAVNSKAGSAYETINGKNYLKLTDFNNQSYTVRENGIVYDAKGNATDMYVDEGNFATAFSTKGDLYQTGKNGAAATYLGNIYLRGGRDKNGITRPGSKTAPLFTAMTGFLWLLTSEDQGQTWSAPVDLTPDIKEDWMGFVGTGAAAGCEIDVKHDDGTTTKRLIFPIYYTNQQGSGMGRQSSANIYSDDGGQTWHRGESPNDGRIFGNGQQTNSKDFNTSVTELSENQIVQLNNGHLLQFMRNTGKTIAVAVSKDYGQTWDDNVIVTELPEPYVNLSAIHMNLNGKEYIVLSNPLGDPQGEQIKVRNQRNKGILRIGEVQSDDSIKWVSANVFEPYRFAYSSLVQLDQKTVGIAYEHNGHIKYQTFDLEQMLTAGVREDAVIPRNFEKEITGDQLLLKVRFDTPVFITGEQKLAVQIGDKQVLADYVSGDGTDELVFSYHITEDDEGQIKVGLSPTGKISNKYGFVATDMTKHTVGFIGEIRPGAAITEMFDKKANDKTWVFVGGETTQGGFAQTGGVRNYVGQFEEYIRWTRSETELGRQRYTINTAQKGMDLATILANYDELVAKYGPKAVAYCLGDEDLQKGDLTAYQQTLTAFIDRALTDGFVVLQMPYATRDEAKNEQIKRYIEATKAVIANYGNDDRIDHIVLVDHFSATNNDDFKQNCLGEDGKLNAKGHLEIGRQLAQATIQTTEGYPGNNVTLDLNAKPEATEFLKESPKATYSDGKLAIESGQGTWHYELKIGPQTLTGDFTDQTSLELSAFAGQNYELVVTSADGKMQLKTVTGTLKDQTAASVKTQTLDRNQQRIKDLLENKQSVTWLFMGDSITHAAAWTNGYDGIAQSFEKYLTDDLGRTQDVVLNTAVSGATVASTLAQIDQRLDKYSPDVISIMLGTNDVANAKLTPAQFKEQLQQLIEKARKKNAIIILRTPTPTLQAGRAERIPEFIEMIKQIAAQNEDLLLIDQYTPFKEMVDKYPYLWEKENLFVTDGIPLHPGPNGQLFLTKLFIQGVGLSQYGSHIEDLEYVVPTTTTQVSQAPVVEYDAKSQTLSLDLAKVTGVDPAKLAEYTLVAKEKYGTKTYQITGKTGILTLKGLLAGKEYEISLQAAGKDTPVNYLWQTVSVGEQEVEKPTPPMEPDASNPATPERPDVVEPPTTSEVPEKPILPDISETPAKPSEHPTGELVDPVSNKTPAELPQLGERPKQSFVGLILMTLATLFGLGSMLDKKRKDQ